MHRFLAEGAQEPECQQVEVAVHKTVQSHKLRRAVLTGLMLYHLLTNLIKAGILRQIRNITMHLTIHLDILHHRLAIGFQTAVEVVQVLDTAHLPCCGIEEFRGQGLRQRVVTFLLIAAHKVITLFLDHLIESGDLIRRILQIGIHRDDHVTLCLFKATIERRTLAVVSAELDALHHIRILLVQFTDNLPRAVRRTVVDENHLITESILLHHPLYPLVEFWYRLLFIIKRYNH